MSINDAPEIRKLYKGFRMEVVETSYMAGGADKKKKVKELDFDLADFVMISVLKLETGRT